MTWWIQPLTDPDVLRPPRVGCFPFFVSRITQNYLNTYSSCHYCSQSASQASAFSSEILFCAMSSSFLCSNFPNYWSIIYSLCKSSFRFHFEQPASQEIFGALTWDGNRHQLLGKDRLSATPDSLPCSTTLRSKLGALRGSLSLSSSTLAVPGCSWSSWSCSCQAAETKHVKSSQQRQWRQPGSLPSKRI